MTTPATLSGAVATATALLAILGHVELWQRKEYRWDRVRAFIRSSDFWLHGLPVFSISAVLLALGLGWLSLLGFAAHYGLRTLRRGLIRPVFTLKAIINLIVSSGIALALLHTNRDSPLGLAGVIFCLPFLTATVVGLVNIPFWLKKRAIIRQATRKRQQLNQLTVVGITGSFGKTSTKHFLFQLLTAIGKNVLASAEHRNAELPVAQDILARLTPETEVYIVELGAYRRGEVAAGAQLTQPGFGVLTTLGNQHLDLFGSLENIVAAKWELITSLPANGIAILNADDSKQVKQAIAYPPVCPIVWYSSHKSADVWAEKVVIHPTSITCTLHVKNKVATVELPLASEALLQSAVAAIAAAAALGHSLTELKPVLATLTPCPRTMEIKTGAHGTTIIDDSYSANEAGVLVALRHLQRFPQKNKIIVLVPLIELGKESKAVHERIEAAIAKSGVKAYIYKSGSGPEKLVTELKQYLSVDTVILLEGRLPDVVRQSVL